MTPTPVIPTDVPPTRIKAIVIRSPECYDIGRGFKVVEYRSWPTKHRGPLVIVAAKRKESGAFGGHAVCVVDVTGCRQAGPRDYEWTLARPRFIVPVPVKGRLGLMDVCIPLDFDVEYDWPDEEPQR